MHLPRSGLVVLLCASSLVQLALGESLTPNTCFKYVSEQDFSRNNEIEVTITTTTAQAVTDGCIRYESYSEGECVNANRRAGSLTECQAGFDPMTSTAPEMCAAEIYMSPMTNSSEKTSEYSCNNGFDVVVLVQNTCTYSVEFTVTVKDLGDVPNSVCDLFKDAEKAVNTILIVILVVAAIAVVGGALGCCLCCQACPLHKACCGNKNPPPPMVRCIL